MHNDEAEEFMAQYAIDYAYQNIGNSDNQELFKQRHADLTNEVFNFFGGASWDAAFCQVEVFFPEWKKFYEELLEKEDDIEIVSIDERIKHRMKDLW